MSLKPHVSTTLKQVLFILCTFVCLNASATEPRIVNFDALEYFDRALLVRSKVAELKLTITSHRRGESPEEDPHACIVVTYLFDQKGNLIRRDLNRMGSYNYYSYDAHGKLIDWGWEDKSSGEITSIAEEVKRSETGYEKERAETERRLNAKLNSSTDYKQKMVRGISDPCFSINAKYDIVHKNTGRLPKEAIAKLNPNNGKSMPKDRRSVKILYIYYDYVFHK